MNHAHGAARQAFARVLNAEGFRLQALHEGSVFVSDPLCGSAPNLFVRRTTDGTYPEASILVTIDERITDHLAVAIEETLITSRDGLNQTRRPLTMVLTDGDRVVIDVEGHFVKQGEIAMDFWDRAGHLLQRPW